MVKFQLAIALKSLDYYKGYEQALKDFRRRVDNMQEYGG